MSAKNPKECIASIRQRTSEGWYERCFAYGEVGVSEIILRLRNAGFTIVRLDQMPAHDGHGPTIITPTDEIISVDLWVYKGVRCAWIECKRKAGFEWGINRKRWMTGIDCDALARYQALAKTSVHPVWLFMLHGNREWPVNDEWKTSPSGLFGQELSVLVKTVRARAMEWGASGMVYWDIQDLIAIDLEAKASVKLLAQPVIHEVPPPAPPKPAPVKPAPPREAEQIMMFGEAEDGEE